MSITVSKSIFYLVCISLIISCNHEHGQDTHVHDEQGNHVTPAQNDSHDHGDTKMVHLSEMQFNNAGIDTGWFEMKNLNEVIHANGYTKLAPQNEAEVSMPISGTIRSIFVIEGDQVRKGQTLAIMTSLDYNNMLLEKAKLQEELVLSESNLEYLQLEYDRQKTLAEENINAQKVFQKVRSDLSTTEAKISAVRQQITILDGTIGLLGTAEDARLRIRAPINGYVTEVNTKIGSVVQPGEIMFALVDNSKMHVDLLVYEKDLNKIKIDQNVRFVLTNQSNQEFNGRIYNIGKAFEDASKAVAVHADIDVKGIDLIPGMYVDALVDIGNNQVKTLPDDAVIMAEGREFIFLWIADNIENVEEIEFERLEVKTGAQQLGFVEVTPLGEIHTGDKIVTHGAYYLQSHLQKEEGGGGHHH